MVGAPAAILVSPAAELREGYHQQPVLVPAGRHVLVEGGHGIRELLQEPGVHGHLVGVRVEAVEGDVEDAGTQVSVDELGRQLETVGQGRVGIGEFGLVVLADLLQPAAAVVGADRGSLDEIEETRLVGRRASHAFQERVLLPAVQFAGGDRLELVVLEGGQGRHANGSSRQSQRRALIFVGEVKGGRSRHALQGPADPPLGQGLCRAASLPDVHGPEVGLARIRIAHPLDDAQSLILQKSRQPVHRGVQADLIVQLLDFCFGLLERRPQLAVFLVGIGNDGVKPVVAAG